MSVTHRTPTCEVTTSQNAVDRDKGIDTQVHRVGRGGGSAGPAMTSLHRDPLDIDTSVPHAARVHDFLLGGVDNFAVDRQIAIEANAHMPGGLEGARANVRANRRFLGRAVRYLAREAGVRQFLDIGTGVPSADNVHAIAQAVAPESRIVCADNDPIAWVDGKDGPANASRLCVKGRFGYDYVRNRQRLTLGPSAGESGARLRRIRAVDPARRYRNALAHRFQSSSPADHPRGGRQSRQRPE